MLYQVRPMVYLSQYPLISNHPQAEIFPSSAAFLAVTELSDKQNHFPDILLIGLWQSLPGMGTKCMHTCNRTHLFIVLWVICFPKALFRLWETEAAHENGPFINLNPIRTLPQEKWITRSTYYELAWIWKYLTLPSSSPCTHHTWSQKHHWKEGGHI